MKLRLSSNHRTPRPTCYTCRRAAAVCLCHQISPVSTTSEFLFVAHPREAQRKTGSGILAHLALSRSRYIVGIEFPRSSVLQQVLHASESPPWLVFPSAEAQPVTPNWPPAGSAPNLFVFIESTWSQAQTMLRLNPVLQDLPRVGLPDHGPSQFKIRTQPRPECLSTIEAAAHLLLSRGEVSPAQAQTLLRPFHAMVEQQIGYQRRFNDRHARKWEKKLSSSI